MAPPREPHAPPTAAPDASVATPDARVATEARHETREAGAFDEAHEARAELERARAYLASRPPAVAAPRAPAPRAPTPPFAPLPPLTLGARRALEAIALEANDRYLETFLEPHSFCPFSRGGRKRGLTHREVCLASSLDVTPWLDLMEALAADPTKVVAQLIFPAIEVPPDAWSRFCHELTTAGNERMRVGVGKGAEVFAVAPLHPELGYSTKNAYTLIPLLRRTPDPTVQWVRLDALEKLYEGRSAKTVFVDVAELEAFLAAPQKKPLFDRIAETNQQMAERLGVAEVERTLRELSRWAQARYARALLDDEPGALGAASEGSPARAPERERSAPVTDTSPPRAPLDERGRGDRAALVRVDELERGVPVRFLVHGVEVAVVRAGSDVHVLHGRCPHRNAPLSDASVDDDALVCPHHGWDFSLATGRSRGVPGAAIARFDAEVEHGVVWVERRSLAAYRAAEPEAFRDDDDVL